MEWFFGTGWVIRAIVIATFAAGTYFGSHVYFLAYCAAASAVFGTASGAAWVVSASLPRHHRTIAAKLNLIAAVLSAVAAICLLP